MITSVAISQQNKTSLRTLAIEASLWTSVLLLGLVAITYHAIHCFFPYLLVPSEAGMLQTTRALSLGIDPWLPANAFDYSNDYGVIYPWIVAQLKPLVPAMKLIVFMRYVSAAAAFIGLGFIFGALRASARTALEALAACVAIYAGLLYYDTLTARPDALAFALYMGGLLWAARRGRWNLAGAGAMGALGFFVKPYALLAFPMAIVFLWAQGRLKEIIWLCLGFTLTAFLLGGTILHFSPYYLDGTYFIHLHATRYSFGHMLGQWLQMAKNHWPILMGIIGSGLFAFKKNRRFLPDGVARAWAVLTLAIFVVLALGPGGHVGAFLRYYQQLFLPVAILTATIWFAQLGLSRGLIVVVLVVDGSMMMAYNIQAYPLTSYAQEREWKRAETWVETHPYGIYPAEFISILIAKNAYVFKTDHNGYLVTLAPDGPVKDNARARVETAAAEVRAGHFQSVIDERDLLQLVSGLDPKYRMVGNLCLQTPLSEMKCFYVYESLQPNVLRERKVFRSPLGAQDATR